MDCPVDSVARFKNVCKARSLISRRIMEAAALRVELNEFVWHELYTRDVNGAVDFYTHVVGWRIATPDGNGIEEPRHLTLFASGVPVGAITKDETEPGALPPYWSAYVNTPNIHETRRRVEKLDGDLLGDISRWGAWVMRWVSSIR